MWARGIGDASFSIDVRNGSATVNLSFSLSPPDKLHELPAAQCIKKLDGDAKPNKMLKKVYPMGTQNVYFVTHD